MAGRRQTLPPSLCRRPCLDQADEAYRLGPALASQSYLRGDIILDIAKRCGAQVKCVCVCVWRVFGALMLGGPLRAPCSPSGRASTQATAFCPRTQSLQPCVQKRMLFSLGHPRQPSTPWARKGVSSCTPPPSLPCAVEECKGLPPVGDGRQLLFVAHRAPLELENVCFPSMSPYVVSPRRLWLPLASL